MATALGIDMWTWSEAYSTGLSVPAMPRSFAGILDSRAMASAIRLAAEPPPVSVPEKPLQPTASASHRTTVRSIVTPAGEERQAVMFWFRIEASKSPSAATGWRRTLDVAEEASILRAAVGDHV